MLRLISLFLLLSQHHLSAQAAPAALNPPSLSLNTITALTNSTPLSLFDQTTLTSLALLLNSSNPDAIDLYRVPGTHTILRIAVKEGAIAKTDLGRTILRTQQTLAAFIRSYDADDKPLARLDDPYESNPHYTGCFFGVATFPMDSHHLTYGIVMNVLQGLWLYLYRAGRYQGAVFEVRDDQFGTVGVGRITDERPGG
ncbi:hypothetical protein BDR22DRAFT_892067 [Usnea florida]